MDASSRLKIKIGENIFEAEGSPDEIREQYRMFMEIVSSMPTTPSPLPQSPAPHEPPPAATCTPQQNTPNNELSLGKIIKVEGRIVSLTMRPKTLEDGVMLILLGQKVMREMESTTGGEILDGLKMTGGLAFGRIDRLMEKLAKDGDIVISGENRGKRYRMTNAGVTRARQLSQDLIALLA